MTAPFIDEIKDLSQSTGSGTRRLNEIAEEIQGEHRLLYCEGFHYEYSDGVYKKIGKEHLHKIIRDKLCQSVTPAKVTHIYEVVKLDTLLALDKELNGSGLMNLKNGMLDLETLSLKPHDPEYFSSIQLPVNYNPDAECALWLKTLREIFHDDIKKADTLQEFFGLSLTRDQRYRKALFMLGDGANGKSTVSHVLEKILGRENISSIPLEKFNDFHYTASLYQKLVNISIETNAKSTVYDAAIKSITSGDSMTADFKYGQQFQFNPFCKLIFALNNMPRVDDKTNAFFDRLLIVKFNRRFEDHEQNKNLKFELEAELDGIFLWMINGLKNLRARGVFEVTAESKKAIEEYRSENNNVLLFVEDACLLDQSFRATKHDIYEKYKAWCIDSRHQALSKKRFGMEFSKNFPQVNDGMDSSGESRIWKGIGIKV
jgi:putative DNA primase/helicase